MTMEGKLSVMDIRDLCSNLETALKTMEILDFHTTDEYEKYVEQYIFARNATMKEALNILQQIDEALKIL